MHRQDNAASFIYVGGQNTDGLVGEPGPPRYELVGVQQSYSDLPVLKVSLLYFPVCKSNWFHRRIWRNMHLVPLMSLVTEQE